MTTMGSLRSFRSSCSAPLAIGVALAISTVATAASAQTVVSAAPKMSAGVARTERDLDLPAQALETALLRYSEQAGIQLLFDPAAVAGMSAKAIKGRYSSDRALAHLLEGLPLIWRAIGPHTITIEPKQGGLLPQDHLLAPLRVLGVRDENADDSRLKWEATLLTRMRREKNYPRSALENGEEDIVYVRITVDRHGRVSSSSIVRSKHFDALDQAALDLVRRVGRLPPLPRVIEGTQYTFIVPIDYFIGRLRIEGGGRHCRSNCTNL